MAFNINEFRAKLAQGGARPSQFEVILTPPAFAGLNIEDFTFKCKAAQLPTSTLGMIEVPYFGRRIKIAGDRTFEDWTVTVINDEDFAARNALEAWQTAIASYTTNTNNVRNGGAGASPNSYVGKALVNHYGKEGNIIKTVELINVFPTNIAAIDLNWESSDTVEEFTVTLAYDYFNAGNLT